MRKCGAPWHTPLEGIAGRYGVDGDSLIADAVRSKELPVAVAASVAAVAGVVAAAAVTVAAAPQPFYALSCI